MRSFKLKARILKYRTIWFGSGLLSRFSGKKLINHNYILPDEHLENILILAPHADDEWIGCSRALQRSEKSTVYYFNFLGKNYSSANEKTRLEEIRKLSKIFSFELIISENREDYSDFQKLITDKNYSAVFIPFPLDWHPEHIKVNDIAQEIISKSGKNFNLYFYHISVPIPEVDIRYSYLPLSGSEAKEKIKVFDENYVSQKNTPIRRLVLQNKIWAQGQKFYAAEMYARFQIIEWKEFLIFVHKNYPAISKTVHHIDFPLRIRKLSNRIYKDFNY